MKRERYYANGIDYELIEEADGWVSVYELDEATFERIPKIQAADMTHAKSYCNLTERISVPFNIL